MSATNDPGLWQFSVAVYDVPGVRDSCLSLQEATDADVNLLLTLLFAASRGIELDAPRVKRLIDRTDEWRRRVVVPLRSARRAIKEMDRGRDGLYDVLKNVELEAEKIAQQLLEDELDVIAGSANRSDPTIAATVNLAAYASQVALPERELTALLAAFLATEKPLPVR